jgi:hypothetical protein
MRCAGGICGATINSLHVPCNGLACQDLTCKALPVLLQTDLTHPMARLDLAASSLFMFDCWMNFRAAYVGELRGSSLGVSSYCWLVGLAYC